MARRLPCSDHLRGAPIEFSVDGKPARGFDRETIAAAAFASGIKVMSRSLKYHRPRTFFCLEGHCAGCLVRIDGVPNVRACLTGCANDVAVEGQNAYPSAEVDLLGAVDFLFPRGMDHHTLMTSSSILNQLASKVVRQLSGLGRLPSREPTELPAVAIIDVDVCVIGGGPAGLAAATAAGATGARVVLVDDQVDLGGSLLSDPRHGAAEVATLIADVAAAGVVVHRRSTAIAYFPEDDGGVLAVATPDRLLHVRARQWVWATGGYAVNLPFADNDRPGVLAARAVGRLLVQHAVLAGDRITVVEGEGAEDYAAALTAALGMAGAEVTRVPADEVERARGRGWVSSVELTSRRRVECDVVAVAALPAPASEGPRQHGCAVRLEPSRGGFVVIVDDHGHTSAPNVWACGDVCGFAGPVRAAAAGTAVGASAAAAAREPA